MLLDIGVISAWPIKIRAKQSKTVMRRMSLAERWLVRLIGQLLFIITWDAMTKTSWIMRVILEWFELYELLKPI